jgi:5-methylcytosine-specific restriction enzyme A
MPARPLRPCRHAGCGALVREKHGLCPLHLSAMRQRVDEQRDSASERGYGARWRRARAAFLRLHPLCECDECRAQHRLLPATVVDHRVPHRGDMTLFWDSTNWQALSKRCHDRKTAREDGGFGNARKQRHVEHDSAARR